MLRAVAALEFVHASALVHDDVMDGAQTRRGRPATHIGFAARHGGDGLDRRRRRRSAPARRSWSATSRWSGPTSCSAAPASPPDALTRARAVWDTMRTEVTAGQYLDLLARRRRAARARTAR